MLSCCALRSGIVLVLSDEKRHVSGEFPIALYPQKLFSRCLSDSLAKDSHALCLKIEVMAMPFLDAQRNLIVTSTTRKTSDALWRIYLGSPQTLYGAKSTPLAWGTLQFHNGVRNLLRTRKREHRLAALTNAIRIV